MNEEMSLGQWIGTLVLTFIPCVNIIMLLIWAFGNGSYVARKRWAQAQLIVMVIVFAITFILSAVLGASLTALLGSMNY